MAFSRSDKHLWKGLAAGFAGGLAASFIMGQFHAMIGKMSPVAKKAEKEGRKSTAKAASTVARTVFHQRLDRKESQAGGMAVHFAFGGAMGALYGASAELNPTVAVAAGLPFGMSLWLAAHEIAVPALGWSKPPNQAPFAEHVLELASHLIYGFTTDAVRRLIRKVW